MTRLFPSNGWRARAAVLTALIAVASVAAGDHPQNDAGSGGDAGDTRETALLLGGYGFYEAQLTPHDTVDWFRVDDTTTTGPACVRVDFGGKNNLTSALVVSTPQGDRVVSAYVPGGARTTLAIATSDARASHLNFYPSPNDPNSGSPARPGPYDFTVDVKRGATMSDAGTGTDAGSSPETAIVLNEGCHGGRLGIGQLSMDSVDYYRIFVPAGEVLTYSLGAAEDAPVSLVLTDDAGNALDDPIGPDGFATYTALTDQSIYIQTSTMKLDATQFPYLLGLEVGPPGEPTCNPNC